jgi:hypothetical protein
MRERGGWTTACLGTGLADHANTMDKKIVTGEVMERRRKRWREPRFGLRAEIEVSGIDGKGKPFSECTVTRDVSEWGCSFVLSCKLERSAPVAIRVIGKQEHCIASVEAVMFLVAHTRQEDEAWIIGASKIQAEKLWNVSEMGEPIPEEAAMPRKE